LKIKTFAFPELVTNIVFSTGFGNILLLFVEIGFTEVVDLSDFF